MRHHLISALAMAGIVIVGYWDHQSGSQVSMMLFYALPIYVAAWFCGRTQGAVVAVTAAACWVLANLLSTTTAPPGRSEIVVSWNALTRVGIFLLIAYSVSLQAALKRALVREKLRAATDGLTGLLNQGAFREKVEEELDRARRYNHPFSLAFIDLDNFKEVNDTQGHARGDRLLQQVGTTIVHAVRKTDTVGRVGGDEFGVFFPETAAAEVRHAIDKLVGELAIMTSQSGWQVTASIGVVSGSAVAVTYDALLKRADSLMYLAKQKGKNVAEFALIDAAGQ